MSIQAISHVYFLLKKHIANHHSSNIFHKCRNDMKNYKIPPCIIHWVGWLFVYNIYIILYIYVSGWWFQPLWKILVSWNDSPQWKIESISKSPTSIYYTYIHRFAKMRAPQIIQQSHAKLAPSASFSSRKIFFRRRVRTSGGSDANTFKSGAFALLHLIALEIFYILLQPIYDAKGIKHGYSWFSH